MKKPSKILPLLILIATLANPNPPQGASTLKADEEPPTIIFRKGSFTKRIVYILECFEAAAAWAGAADLANAASQVLERSGLVEVRRITLLEELDKLVRDPPKDIAVINSHGETIPMPHSWGANWRDYYRAIGRNVAERRWIWVGAVGYPFYYYSNRPAVNNVTGESGMNEFLSVVGATANCWSDGYRGNATMAARKANETYGAGLPDSLPDSDRSISTALTPIYVYYSTAGERMSAAAFSMGNGVYIHIGAWGTEHPVYGNRDIRNGRIAAAIVLDVGTGPYISFRSVEYDEISMKLKVIVEARNFNPYEEVSASMWLNITTDRRKIFEQRGPQLTIKPGEMATASFETMIFTPGAYIVRAYLDPALGKRLVDRGFVATPILIILGITAIMIGIIVAFVKLRLRKR